MPITANQQKAIDIIVDAFVANAEQEERANATDDAIVAVQNLTDAGLLNLDYLDGDYDEGVHNVGPFDP